MHDTKARPKSLYLREVGLLARIVIASPLQLAASDITSNFV